MPHVAFQSRFGELAERETRTVILPKRTAGLPPGDYSLLEMYCDEPGCDCRRVMFSVFSSASKSVEAVIAYGWESRDFYARWMHDDDPRMLRELQGPVLNLGSPQSPRAPAILDLVKNVVLRDARYIERLKRHYRMFREAVHAKPASKGQRKRVTTRKKNRRQYAMQGRAVLIPNSGAPSCMDSHSDDLFEAACSQWQLGRRKEAAKQLREVLRLDANDGQHARYWLAACLFDLQRHDELKQHLEDYDEPTAVWRYARALFAFRLGGDTDDARCHLEEAARLDASFLDYLLGDNLVYADKRLRFGGNQGEMTHSMAALFLPAWRATPGAASWARRVLRVPLGDPPAEMPFPREELCELPRRDVRWQMGLRLLDREESACSKDRGWMLGIANLDEQKMMHMTVIEGGPTPETVWHGLLSAFLQPMEGKSHRPARLELPQMESARACQPLLAKMGVTCELQQDPQPITEMLGGMAALLREQQLPPLSEDIDPREFPQNDEVWQADLVHTPVMVSNEEVGVERPWSAIVIDRQSCFVLSNELIQGEPTPEHLWEHLLRTMAHPGPRDPARPLKIELTDSDCYDFIGPKLRELDVACSLVDELPQLQEFCQELASNCGGPEKCALTDGARVTREQMESFYYAAAHYFRRAPWKHVAGEIPIKIRCQAFGQGTMYAIVLGRTGVTMGLALYRGWNEVLAMLRGHKNNEEMSGFSIVFDEVAIMAPADLHLVERNGWPICTQEAYPVVMRHEPSRQPQSPRSEDLDYLETCLHVIPDFVASNREAKTYVKVTNGRQFKMQLSWTSPRP